MQWFERISTMDSDFQKQVQSFIHHPNMARFFETEERVGREFFKRGSFHIFPIYHNPNRKKYNGKRTVGRKRQATHNAIRVCVWDTTLPNGGSFYTLGTYTRLKDFKADLALCQSAE